MVKRFYFALILIGVLLLTMGVPVASQTKTYQDVYAYRIDAGFDLDAMHTRILETGIRDIAIGAYLWSITDNIQPLLNEIEWAKRTAHARTIWVIDYSETTRTGYEFDGVYRLYRSWDSRVEAIKKLGEAGADYFIIDVSVMHYPASSDITAYLLALNTVVTQYGMKFGVYDGDGVVDQLDFKMLEWAGIYIWSDIYIDGDSAYLRSSCGWDYPYLITLNWMGEGSWQFNDPGDFQAARDLMNLNNFTGYNVIETFMYDGILPDWE